MNPIARLPVGLRAAALTVCVGVILWLSLSPLDELPKVSLWDKAEHAIAYATFTAIGLILFPRQPRRLVAGAMALGIVIEVLQAVMGLGRQGDWRDAVANAAGAFGVLLAAGLVRRLTGARGAPAQPSQTARDRFSSPGR